MKDVLFTIDLDEDVSAKVSSSRTPLCAIISHNNERLVFPLSSIITKKDTVDIDHIEQFYILNDFIARKGEEFKLQVFEMYKYLYGLVDKFSDSLSNDNVDLYPEFYKLFDMFPIEELIEHIKILVEIGKVNIPSNLTKVIDEHMVKDEIGSEEQTYLKEDYVELVGLVTFVKATYPILIKYDTVFLNEKNGPKKDIILFDIYRNYLPFMESKPMQKLGQFTEQIVLGPKRDDSEIKQQMLEKSLSKEDFKPYFLAQIVIERLSIAPILRDTDERHLVLSNYGFLMNRVNSSGSPKHKVKAVVPMVSADGEQESVYETMKQTTEISLATQSTINVSCSSVDFVLRQFSMFPKYGDYINQIQLSHRVVSVHEVREQFENIRGLVIPSTTVLLVKTFAKKIFDPRFVNVLNIDSMLNLMSVTFTYMYNLGFKSLALYLASVAVEYSDNHSVYSGNDIKKLDPDIVNELRNAFPLYTPPTKQVKEKIYIIEDKVKEFTRKLMDGSMMIMLDENFLSELFELDKDYRKASGINLVAIPSELRKIISLYLIKNEEIRKD